MTFFLKRSKTPGIAAALLVLAASSAQAGEKWVCQPGADQQEWECVRGAEVMLPGKPQPAPPAMPAAPATPVTPPSPGAATATAPAWSAPAHATPDQVRTGPSVADQCSTPGWRQPPVPDTARQAGETLINADQSSGTVERFELTGNVDIIKDNQRLLADRVIYDQQQDRADAEGNVLLLQEGIQIKSTRGYKQIEGEQAEFENARFLLPERNGRGTAKTIFVESATQTHLTDTTYSTCPPGNQDWELRTGKLALDKQTGTGTARDVSLRFKGVPFLYTPYLSFPIDDRRKSGFLMPSYGSTDNTGTDISIPYYWNIAPNRDATITLRNMSKRGVQVGAEYRYLHDNSSGQLAFEALPDDQLYGDDRSLLTYTHSATYGDHWSNEVLLNNASDDDYFTDLGENLSLSSITHLERRIDLTHTQDNWSLRTRLQNFQPINSAENYQRLPQLTLTTTFPEQINGFNYSLGSEFVRFDHKDNKVDGERLDLYPAVAYDYSEVGYYLRPKLGLHYTRYSLNNPDAGNPDDPSRTVPVFSIDSAIFLERDTTWGERKLLHTLEPRLFYLYTPYRDQNGIPTFDTGELTFSSAALFRENRFSGADRQGDANQISLGVTTRFTDHDSGFEYLNATIGEIFYLEDRRVTNTTDSLQTSNRSDLVADATVNLSRYASLSSSLQWDTYQEHMSKSSLTYQYRQDERHILNARYRQERSSQEQVDLSAYWPLSQHWSGVARYYYSLRDEQTLEGVAGLEYDTCCWSLRFVARRYTSDGITSSNAFFIQLNLKGLTSIGDEPTSFLEEGIFGYSDVLGAR